MDDDVDGTGDEAKEDTAWAAGVDVDGRYTDDDSDTLVVAL